ncbi:hypothetical protein F5884DRAFT_761145 [Xylogone sp. PMI_703]|nr:hypothetical protein F5884DRAFT_761145 [Xylogone sp. PMI_703]
MSGPPTKPLRSTRSRKELPGNNTENSTPLENKDIGQSSTAVDEISATSNGVGLKDEELDYADLLEQAMRPLTDEERQNWQGWVELESDPALFNFILRQYGVKDVKVQEVLSLDDEILQQLPQPVFGLIFLFKYEDGDLDDRKSTMSNPEHIWFANQTTNNACATIALLNIVMNVPGIDLGHMLSEFKTTTQPLKPAYRGWELSKHQTIRAIHNSFARRMDMLAIDYALSQEVEEWKREKEGKRKRKKAREETEAAFHFVAYAPIKGELWRLDGLQWYPINLGKCEGDWISIARKDIYERIGQSKNHSLEFNLLSLCQSPLKTIPQELARNIKSAALVEKSLGNILPDWRSFVPQNDSSFNDVNLDPLGLPQELIDSSEIPSKALERIKLAEKDASGLLDLLTTLLSDRDHLLRSHIDEVNLIQQQNEQAERRKRDYTWLLFKALKTLADKGVLDGIIKEVQEIEKLRRS